MMARQKEQEVNLVFYIRDFKDSNTNNRMTFSEAKTYQSECFFSLLKTYFILKTFILITNLISKSFQRVRQDVFYLLTFVMYLTRIQL